MSFTEAEKRKWHADRKNENATDSDNYSASTASCSHCGIALGSSADNSDFPLCNACDGE